MAFEKGMTPWNKGKKVYLGKSNPFYGKKHSPEAILKMSLAKKGKVSSFKGKIGLRGKKHFAWKEHGFKYGTLHSWVRRMLGKAQECVYCGMERGIKKIGWASISHNAKRDLDDYISLCSSCHGKYDRGFRKARLAI